MSYETVYFILLAMMLAQLFRAMTELKQLNGTLEAIRQHIGAPKVDPTPELDVATSDQSASERTL